MAVNTPEDLTAKVISLSSIKLTWSKATSPDVGILHYNIYKDGEFLNLISYRDVTEYIDANVVLDTTYEYQVSTVDRNHEESDLSSAISIAFTEENFNLYDLEVYLNRNGGQNMELIVNQNEYPILTAVQDYSYDVGQAIDQPVKFDRSYRTSINNNITSFFYIPMDDLINYDIPDSAYTNQSTKNRRFFTSTIVNQKLSDLFRKVISVAERFELGR